MTDRFPDSQDGSGVDLRHSLLRSRIAKLPHLPAIAPPSLPDRLSASVEVGGAEALVKEEEEEEQEDGHDTLGSLSKMPPLTSKRARARARQGEAFQDEFSPLSADDCFDQALEVDLEDEGDAVDAVRNAPMDGDRAAEPHRAGKRATVRVYFTPPRRRSNAVKPKITSFMPLLNGEGASAGPLRTSAGSDGDDDEEAEEEEGSGSAGTIFFLHHGAGYSALSFALMAKSITQQAKGRAGVLAYDCRGHGKTTFASSSASRDLSLSNLTQDALLILRKMFPPGQKQPTLILVGHSMGGAVVVSLAHALASAGAERQALQPRVAGVAVLDVVEGTAMSALPSMKTIVSQLPQGFDSISDAIRWHIDSGTIVNAHSARRSVPSLLKPNEVSAPVEGQHADDRQRNATEDEPVEEILSTSPTSATTPQRPASSYDFVWRHDLLSTEPHWRGWFEGLSKEFLTVKCARLLLLAGTDRLDKELMIGQMQGKYQLVVLPDVGHSLQEDAPQRTAQTLVEFWQRNERVNASAVKGLRKVGQS